jgi:hypothetical protein
MGRIHFGPSGVEMMGGKIMNTQEEQIQQPKKKVNAAAVVSLCLGVILFTFTCWAWFKLAPPIQSMLFIPGMEIALILLGIAGIVPGVLGWVRVRKSGGAQREKALAIAGVLVCGFVVFFHGMNLSSDLMYTVLPSYRFTHPQNEAQPGLAGYWKDPETGYVHAIGWADGAYTVPYVLDSAYNAYRIDPQSWSNGVLSWTYWDQGASTTFMTRSLNGDRLEIDWSTTSGGATQTGTRTLNRLPWDQFTLPSQ